MTKPSLRKIKVTTSELKTRNSYAVNNDVFKRKFSQLANKLFPSTPLTALILASCGSDTGQGDNDAAVVVPTITSLSGAVVKGPLSGALVYADSDGDGIGDGSPIITGADGFLHN